MPLFGSRFGSRRKQPASPVDDLPSDAMIGEQLEELERTEDKKEIGRADKEVREAVTQATRADIRDVKLMEHGRCPRCRSRTDNFLYTVICPSCGWHRREIPSSGASVVHMDTGEKIACDRVYSAGDAFLCVKDGIVVSQVMRKCVRRVEYTWEESEFALAREQAKKRRTGLCSWCERDLAESEEGGPYNDYVAFGSMQERYVFCSEKCMKSFRKLYPSRIHRNCYETDCPDCKKCIKRYDADGFRRHIL